MKKKYKRCPGYYIHYDQQEIGAYAYGGETMAECDIHETDECTDKKPVKAEPLDH